ncbi:hypothetical protein F5Y13DRAFT_183815 [Hypoxylon sp. FL1857]|nr:hypothetical protein F5Y13DRAFT_183815 [Hypoxylon sp. FL1857]
MFLHERARDEGDVNERHGLLISRWERRRSTRAWLLDKSSNSLWFHAILTAANLVLFVIAIFANSKSLTTGQPDPLHSRSIFRDSIHIEDSYFNVRSVYNFNGTLNTRKSNVDFSGPPRPELEEAWAAILEYQNIRVKQEELGEFAGQKSLIELSDGSGFFVTIAVHHALHCVQRLHRYVYKDHYHVNLSEDDAFALKQHTEHCLDWLRHVPGPVSKDWGKHQCVSWEALMEHLAARAFDPFKPGLLVHPYFGDPYNVSRGAQTGAVVLAPGEGLIGGDQGPDV